MFILRVMMNVPVIVHDTYLIPNTHPNGEVGRLSVKIPGNPEEIELGITFSLSIIDKGNQGVQVRLQGCQLLIWQSAPNIDTLVIPRLKRIITIPLQWTLRI